VIFHSYVKLPEGNLLWACKNEDQIHQMLGFWASRLPTFVVKIWSPLDGSAVEVGHSDRPMWTSKSAIAPGQLLRFKPSHDTFGQGHQAQGIHGSRAISSAW